MSEPDVLHLTVAAAAAWIARELEQASQVLPLDLEAALDGYIRALGLALQLGPALMEWTLDGIRGAALFLGADQNATALSTLGPAVTGLVRQVRDAEALPPTRVMSAWATATEGLGVLIGQVGLALALPPERRRDLLVQARAQAALLDDVTEGRWQLVDWIDGLPTPSGA